MTESHMALQGDRTMSAAKPVNRDAVRHLSKMDGCTARLSQLCPDRSADVLPWGPISHLISTSAALAHTPIH